MSTYDVVVVGARCAGAATAMLLARLGHDVLVVDRAAFPSDTVSTHSINRTGVVQLRRWGLLDEVMASGAPAIREVAMHRCGEHIVRAVRDSAGVDHMVAPRRHVLDAILLAAAERAGAEVRTEVTVTGVLRDASGRVAGVTGHRADGAGGRGADRRPFEISARVVVGADGLNSRIARAVGARITDDRGGNGSCRYAYFAGVSLGRTELHLGDGLVAGVFPTHDDLANVWACGPDGLVGTQDLGTLIESIDPILGRRLRAGTQVTPARAFRRMPNQLREAAGPGWALVGDAGYFRDAITGHGISDAYRDAEQLAISLDAALRGERSVDAALAEYHRARDAAVAEIFAITVALAAQPGPQRFLELQRDLAEAIDAEAAALAARPPIPQPTHTCTGATP